MSIILRSVNGVLDFGECNYAIEAPAKFIPIVIENTSPDKAVSVSNLLVTSRRASPFATKIVLCERISANDRGEETNT